MSQEFPDRREEPLFSGDRLIVAIDATLAGTQNTGDSAYWRGLIHGLGAIESEFQFCLFTNGPVALPSDLPPHMVWYPLPRHSRRWYSLIALPQAARRIGASVLHGQYNMSPLCRLPTVTTIHDVSFYIDPAWFSWKDRFLMGRLLPGTVARAAAVITVSETSRSEIEETIPEAVGKVHVTYNALDANFFPPPQEEAQRYVSELFGIHPPYALTVGSLWERKNVALAVEAVERCALHLTLALPGKHLAGRLPSATRTKILGYVPDRQLQALYAGAELYLAPSWHEGFGIPLLEAWAASTPVICSSGGALPEIAGDAAVVMPSWDVLDWSGAIDALLADSGKVEHLKQAGRARLKQFSWKKCAEETVQIYREVANR